MVLTNATQQFSIFISLPTVTPRSLSIFPGGLLYPKYYFAYKLIVYKSSREMLKSAMSAELTSSLITLCEFSWYAIQEISSCVHITRGFCVQKTLSCDYSAVLYQIWLTKMSPPCKMTCQGLKTLGGALLARWIVPCVGLILKNVRELWLCVVFIT